MVVINFITIFFENNSLNTCFVFLNVVHLYQDNQSGYRNLKPRNYEQTN